MSTYTAGLVPDAPGIVSGTPRWRADPQRLGLLVPDAPGIVSGTPRWRADPQRLGLLVPEASAITTYYYRLLDGTRSTSTDVGSIPAGAVVERVS